MSNKTLIWFRQDLRINDNLALEFAAKNNLAILPVFILDDHPDFQIGSASKWFLHQSLLSLKADLKKEYDVDLLFFKGDSQKILQDLASHNQIGTILWNRVYEPSFIKRDAEIKANFESKNIAVKSFNSSLLFEIDSIKTGLGGYFRVFTPFSRSCLKNHDKIEKIAPKPQNLAKFTIKNGDNIDLGQLNLLPKNPNFANKWEELWNVSENTARKIIDNFIAEKIENYDQDRNFPATEATSKLSAFIHYGLISVRQIYHRLEPVLKPRFFEEFLGETQPSTAMYKDIHEERRQVSTTKLPKKMVLRQALGFLLFSSKNNGIKQFFNQILWREFSYNLLYNFPDLDRKNFIKKFDNFPWQNNEKDLENWQKGQTGYPLIDAGMRELWQTGWMHNRVRMVVASFLVKNLLIDWRLGLKWFDDCLVDADLANNAASWQWVAGSGCDSAPFFRIFNPILQSEKFDKNGDYIRKWVPELKNLNNKDIHKPFECKEDTLVKAGIILNKDYPKPIIGLKYSRDVALAAYRSI